MISKYTIMKNKGFALIVAALLLLGSVVQAQVLTRGMDAVVTFYGAPGQATNSNPVADIKIVGDQTGAPHHINWAPPLKVPALTNWTSGTMGQVFGIAIDDAGNVYFAATAMYWAGAQNLAALNPNPSGVGGGGYHPSGGPAGVYKADKTALNTVTVLTGTVPAAGGSGKTIPNTGYGLGNIAYAKVIDKLYASNLEDGKIYCLDPASGTILFVYDPFLPDASGAQIAAYGERIFGVAVNYEATGTRLYYAVLMSNNQTAIWSVQLTATGDFVPLSNSIEINLPASYANTYISDIAFSYRGEMLVAEKGDPHHANVYQYYGKHNAWSLPQELYVGSYSGGHNSAGGVDYGYSAKDKERRLFACDTIIWTQSNAISEPLTPGNPWLGYGLLSHPLNDYLNPADYLSEAFIVNLKGAVGANGSGVTPKGSFGDVECYDWTCLPSQTDICSKVSAIITQKDTAECCYTVEVSNGFRPDYFASVSITSNNLSIDNIIKDPSCTWANITVISPTQVVFTKKPFFNGLPLNSSTLGTICLAGDEGPDNITIAFIGNAPQNDTVCTKTVKIEGCKIPVDVSCVSFLDLKAECRDGGIKMLFKIKNNSGFTMRGLTLYSQTPDVSAAPQFISIPDLLPSQTTPGYIETTLVVTNNAKKACFFFAACDQNTTPKIAGPYPNWCCMDSILYCVDIPTCDACNSIAFKASKNDPSDCCYNLSLTTNYNNANIAYLEFTGIGGAQFALLSGWSISGSVGSSHIMLKAPGGGITPGVYPDFASFCLTGTSSPPYTILINSIDSDGVHLCTDTLKFEGCKLVEPTCANIVNDSLYCSGDQVKYTFYVKNNAPFPLYHIDFRTPDPSVVLDINYVEPTIPIAMGSTGGPFTVTIDSSDVNMVNFCMYLTGHNGIYDPEQGLAATGCCTDSLGVVCLPMIKCGECETTICCDFVSMTIPTGITPNEDGINDAFEIGNASCCEYLSIKVYNRWGNRVYQNDDYQNDWIGVNENGDKLVQGTYFIVLELPTGNKKGFYVDVRY
jgi:gliding motility-associated-like protein